MFGARITPPADGSLAWLRPREKHASLKHGVPDEHDLRSPIPALNLRCLISWYEENPHPWCAAHTADVSRCRGRVRSGSVRSALTADCKIVR